MSMLPHWLGTQSVLRSDPHNMICLDCGETFYSRHQDAKKCPSGHENVKPLEVKKDEAK